VSQKNRLLALGQRNCDRINRQYQTELFVTALQRRDSANVDKIIRHHEEASMNQMDIIPWSINASFTTDRDYGDMTVKSKRQFTIFAFYVRVNAAAFAANLP
jgi:hypothetical protein